MNPRRCSASHLIHVSSPLIPISRVLCAAFVRRMLAVLTIVTTTTASELETGVAVSVDSKSPHSPLSRGMQVAATVAGGGYGAA